MEPWPRIVMHADMDAFYAAVEQRDRPELRGKPVLVGPNSNRGVVLTASYEARPYGVGSAMPVAVARRRCPKAIMVEPRFERYQEVSGQVMQVFADFSPNVEAISLDEAFLDMSGATRIFGPPEEIGRTLRQRVREATDLNISVGISATKYVAKVASGFAKPNGLTVVDPKDAVAWLAPMPVDRLWGVGKKTAPRLQAMGYHTIGDIAGENLETLRRLLGQSGMHLHELAHGRDPRVVRSGRAEKSLGSDRTLSEDVSDRRDIEMHLRRSAERIARRLRAKNIVAKGVRVRLKTHDFRLLSRQRVLPQAIDTADALFAAGRPLLDAFDHPGPFRLVGMAAFDLHEDSEPMQMDLFEERARRRLETAIDGLEHRFGPGVVVRARDLKQRDTVMKNGVNLDFLDGQDADDNDERDEQADPADY